MSKKANPAIIGGFVIGAIILSILALLAFAGGKLFRDTDTLVTYFDGSLRGLRVGANVTFRGVKVGEVVDVSVTTDASTLEFSIPVIIEIDKDKFVVVDDAQKPDDSDGDLQDLIEKGLRAQLNVQSMVTGLLEIEMDFFPDTEAVYRNKWLAEYRELPTVPSTAQQLMARIRKWCKSEPSHQTFLSVYSFNKDNVTQDHLRLAPIVTAPVSPEFSLLYIMWVI